MTRIMTLTRTSTLNGQAYLVRPWQAALNHEFILATVRVSGTLAATFYRVTLTLTYVPVHVHFRSPANVTIPLPLFIPP